MNCRRINVNLMGGLQGPLPATEVACKGKGESGYELDMSGSVDDESFRHYTAL